MDGMFGSYDVRGLYGKAVTEKNFFALGRALNSFSDGIVLGHDPRKHGLSLCSSLMEGFDGEKNFLGLAPTTAVAFMARKLGACITASHNPFEFNGAKIFNGREFFSSGYLLKLEEEFVSINGSGLKMPKKFFEPKINCDFREYIEALPEFNGGIFDLRNGSACSLKQVFPETVNSVPDPLLSRVDPEPKDSTLNELKRLTAEKGKVGFAFDFDADRLLVANKGKIVSSNIIACLLAENYLKEKDSVVLTVDLSREAEFFLKDKGFKVYYSKMGQVRVIQKIKETRAKLAAEYSGHYSFVKHMNYSDAIYVAGLLSSIDSKSLEDFSSQFKTLYYKGGIEAEIDFSKLKDLLQSNAVEFSEFDGIRAFYNEYGFFVRKSKSQPKVVHFAVDALNKKGLLKGKKMLMNVLNKCKSKKQS
ncbi:MAG: hypothetical protein AB1467_06380 [Candidatus Diapherotrites archaeon]